MLDERIYADYKSLLRLHGQTDGFSLLPRHQAGSVLSGRHGSRFRGRGLNFEELRHYREGDDIRSLDWKVTLRTGKPHIRAYSEEKDRQVILVIDQRHSLFFGSLEKMKSVVAARLAALLGWRVLKDNDRIGAMVLTDNAQLWFEPKRSRDTWLRILGAVASANLKLSAEHHVDSANRLNLGLRHLARMGLKESVIVVVSDWYGWGDATMQTLKQLQFHNDVLGCYVVDPMEQNLKISEGFVASDGELQLQVEASDKALGQQYQQAASQKQNSITRTFRRQGLPLLLADTGGDELQQLKAALSGHG